LLSVFLFLSAVCVFMSLAFIIALCIRDSEAIFDDLVKIPRIAMLVEKWMPIHNWLTRNCDEQAVCQ
jgi:hypothetical protein